MTRRTVKPRQRRQARSREKGMSSHNGMHSTGARTRRRNTGAAGAHRQQLFTWRNVNYLIDAHNQFLGFIPSRLLNVLDQIETERARASVSKQSIFDFISNRAARELYALLYRQLRSTGGSLVLPIYHETKKVRRHMELTLTVLPSQAILHSCVTIRTERRPSTSVSALQAPDQELMVACSWCNRIKQDERWFSIDQLASQERLFQRPNLPELSHGICPACYQTLLASMNDGTEQRFCVC